MACIVKRPVGGAKGFLTITDGEYNDLVRFSGTLRDQLCALKPHWLIGVHANCPVQQSVAPSDVIDTYIAGPGDLLDTGFPGFHQIVFDCSNFSPNIFRDERQVQEKFWDVLFISRNMPFKSLENLIRIVRAAMDKSPTRVMAIVAHQGLHKKDHGESPIIKQYLETFSRDERRLFTLLTPSIDYPFCFDLPTLAHFYHHSRCFLHVAENERHPRVVAYAWASGLPVVAPSSVGSLLPDDLRRPPGFFAYRDVTEAPDLIADALAVRDLPAAYADYHLARCQTERFKQEVAKFYADKNEPFVDGGWHLENMDIRLARHHFGDGEFIGANSFGSSLFQFAGMLRHVPLRVASQDPEWELEPWALQQPGAPVAREIRINKARWKVGKLGAMFRQDGIAGSIGCFARRLKRGAST